MALVAYPDSDDEGNEDRGRDGDEQKVASPGAAPRSTNMAMSLNNPRQPRPEKRRISCSSDSPPPLPANFHNLYSSSVRVSTSDDPSLHGGRKRIVPHLPGNWAAHVYLEWFPASIQHSLLQKLVNAVTDNTALALADTHVGYNNKSTPTQIHSLLETPLGTPLPLHISLSAPLVLRTETKDDYLDSLLTSLTPIAKKHPQGITVTPDNLSWHTNEDGSRSFLVLRVVELLDRRRASDRAMPIDQAKRGEDQPQSRDQEGDEEGQEESVSLQKQKYHLNSESQSQQQRQQQHNSQETNRLGLPRVSTPTSSAPDSSSRSRPTSTSGLNALLNSSNQIAKSFAQPELYTSSRKRTETTKSNPSTAHEGESERGDFSGSFHISIAWALTTPSQEPSKHTEQENNDWPSAIEEVLAEVKGLEINFSEVKVKVGQDVTALQFGGGSEAGRVNKKKKKSGLFGV